METKKKLKAEMGGLKDQMRDEMGDSKKEVGMVKTTAKKKRRNGMIVV